MIKRFFISLFTFILIVSLLALSVIRPVRTKVDEMILAACGEIGCVYEFGVLDPGRAYDCSSFTTHIFGLFGVHLPQEAKATGYMKDALRIEDKNDLIRGDIVCFDTVEDDDRSDHVGIYLGRGFFVHASSVRGRVTISHLMQYESVYSWGVRVLPSDMYLTKEN